MRAMAPAWLPDWKNQKNYPDPTSTAPQQWAWQFLRRNPEYQQLWKKGIFLQLFYNPASVDANLERGKKELGIRH
jgi:hypothetical protein